MKEETSFLKHDSPSIVSTEFWKILSVDDEPDIHTVTRVALKHLIFEKKRIQFLTAHSSKEAMQVLKEHSDIALILLDVVMETETSGLELIQKIRDDLGNSKVRIILRTGYPGYAPEEEVIIDYDINDYKNKTELTSKRLFSCIIAGLRGYRDILAIEESRKELELSQEQLIQSAKLASLGEMSLSIAHELKQPLSVMSMMAEFALEDLAENQDVVHMRESQSLNLKSLYTQIQRMTKVIHGLQGFGRKSYGSDDKLIDISDLVQKSVELFAHQFYQDSIEISLDFPTTILNVFGNETQIQQVLINLFSNAKDAMESTARKKMTIRGRVQESDVLIEIEDTGTGIPEHLRNKVFQSFVTSKDAGKGTGLGLSISRGIMENHQGTLELHSEEGIGTTFLMRFPEYDAANSESGESK